MVDIAIPASAVGRPGMVAMLRRVATKDVGKLAAVMHPVGFVSSLGSDPRPVFAWQVLLLGEAVELNGRDRREIVVPDACLKPVSQLAPSLVKSMAKARARRDLKEALRELEQYLTKHPMTPEQLDAAIERAGEYIGIEHLLEVAPVPAALQDLDFQPLGPADDDHQTWQRSFVHEGVELHVTAVPVMFDQWRVAGRCTTADKLMWDERLLRLAEPRGQVALLVLDLWRWAFGKAAPVPDSLHTALTYERHREDIRRIGLGLPVLRVDGEALRATRRLIARRFGQDPDEVGPPRDHTMKLAFDEGLLRMDVGEVVYGCPAQGVWVDDCRISLREFLAVPHWRLRGLWVRVKRSPDGLSFHGADLPITATR